MMDHTQPSQTIDLPQDERSSAVSETDAAGGGTADAPVSSPRFGPPTEPGEVGTLGPYRIVKQLGKGGMGAVYLALDTRLNRKLAIKVMLPEFASNPDAKSRFLREARAAAQVTHDNVVTIFEADERDGLPYITMQLLQGFPLDEYLKTKGAPNLHQVMRIARETALGLVAAHELGLVHRDIKPANLWLEVPNGRVKVLDFGLAKPIGTDTELTKSGAVVGTPAYMSPEQARAVHVDHRTDLFSLGSVMYRLCTGKAPFSGPNVMAVLMSLGIDDPVPVRVLNPNVPEALAALIHRLLAKRPEDRPQTATDVANQLEQIIDPPPMATTAEYPAAPPIVVYPVNGPMQAASQMYIAAEPESAFANLDAGSQTQLESHADVAAPKTQPQRSKSSGKGMLVAAGGAVLLAAVVLAGVIIIIKNKDGTETRIEVPDGATVTIKNKDGKTIAQVPKKDDRLTEKAEPKSVEPMPVTPIELIRDVATWANLKPSTLTSESGASLATQPDNSVLVSGKPPATDTFTLTFKGLPGSIQALRLEVLTHDSLPKKGPGRDNDGKFVLTTIKAQLENAKKPNEKQVLKFAEAWASGRSGDDSDVVLAIDDQDQTGWCVKAGDSYVAIFKFAESVATTEDTVLRVTLEFKHADLQQASLGYFRLSVAKEFQDRQAAEYVLSLGESVRVDDADREIKAVADLPKEAFRLTFVGLWGSQKVTDAGLAVFKGCKSITELRLAFTTVTDAGLANFAGSKNITQLELRATQITDVGLTNFKDCKKLVYINVEGTQIGDASLALLKDCKDLANVNVASPKVTDAGVAHLKNLKNMNFLILNETQITDAGLTDLMGLEKLESLHIAKTQVTEKGVADLAKKLPACRISWDGGVIEPKK